MTIWLLVVLMIASVAALGFRQGVIRVSISFFGIIVGALLAPVLGRFLVPVLGVFGVKHPVMLWVLGPVIVFFVISMLFKAGAAVAHQKVDCHFKYRTSDLRQALWERLHHRLGACVGVANGVLYVIILVWGIYAFSYWSVQIADSPDSPRMVRLLNRMGKDLRETGLARVAGAVDGMPARFYDMADVAGLLYQNSLLEARLMRYPGFLGLAERSDFQALVNDKEFAELRQRQVSIYRLMENGSAAAILRTPDSLRLMWNTVVPELADLRSFLETGISKKYAGMKIVGRWYFDVNGAFNLLRRTRTNIPAREMQNWKRWIATAFGKTSIVAMPEKKVIVKNVPQVAQAGGNFSTDTRTLEGEWKDLDTRYLLVMQDAGKEETFSATVEGDRMTVTSRGFGMVFEREY
jgi:hypothetical protein